MSVVCHLSLLWRQLALASKTSLKNGFVELFVGTGTGRKFRTFPYKNSITQTKDLVRLRLAHAC